MKTSDHMHGIRMTVAGLLAVNAMALSQDYVQPLSDAGEALSESDLVCAGTLDLSTSVVSPRDRVTEREIRAALAVDHVIKGDLTNHTCSVLLRAVPGELSTEHPDYDVQQRWLLFLNSDDKQGDVHSVIYGPWRVAALPHFAVDERPSDEERMDAELVQMLRSDDYDIVGRAAGYALFLRRGTSRVLEALREANTRDLPSNERRMVLSSCIHFGDDAALNEAAGLKIPIEHSRYVGGAISSLRDPRQIGLLGKCLNSEDIEIRRGAAHALRRIAKDLDESPERSTMKAILAGALRESDREVLYSVIWALAELEYSISPSGIGRTPSELGSMPQLPSIDMFNADPDRYAAYWRRKYGTMQSE